MCMHVLDALINSRAMKRGIWRLGGAGGLDRAACWRCFLKPAYGERRLSPDTNHGERHGFASVLFQDRKNPCIAYWQISKLVSSDVK